MSLTMFDIYYISHDISYDISCRILCIEYNIYIFTTYLQSIYNVFLICEYIAHKLCKNVEISNVEL